MLRHRIRKYLEPIGLAILLVAFGWQCWEEHANQIKYEGYVYELDQKLMRIWSGIYDEALKSERYSGKAMVWVNYDALNQSMKDWNDIQASLKRLNRQTTVFFWVRVVLYVLGSVLVISGKWPDKKEIYYEAR